jgi:hypothetical protein
VLVKKRSPKSHEPIPLRAKIILENLLWFYFALLQSEEILRIFKIVFEA